MNCAGDGGGAGLLAVGVQREYARDAALMINDDAPELVSNKQGLLIVLRVMGWVLR